MDIIPAIDLKDGKCVRLVQGDMTKVTVFSDDPAEMAKKWESLGAPCIHLVDLDGAFEGSPKNAKTIESIVRGLTVPVQLGGGVRDMQTLDSLISLGIKWVILGTAAVRDPDFARQACDKYPGQIGIGIDAKDGKVAIRGWTEVSTLDAERFASQIEAWDVDFIVYTDIVRDGMLQGPNVYGLKKFIEATKLPVVASGGVTSVSDITAIRELDPSGSRIPAVVVGKALYTGDIDYAAAVRAGAE